MTAKREGGTVVDEENKQRKTGAAISWISWLLTLTLCLCMALLYAPLLTNGAGRMAEAATAVIVLLAFCLCVLWVCLFRPLRRLEEDLRRADREPEAALRGPAKELRALLDEKINAASAEADRVLRDARSLAEWEARLDAAAEMAGYSSLGPWEDYPTRRCFDLAAKVWPGQGERMAFDAFFADQGFLCVLLLRSEGQSAADAMLLAWMLGCLRTQLRGGGSLEECAAAAHRICETRGKALHMQALGLNLSTGACSLLNAGGEEPLLMRSDENSAWCDLGIGEALGRGGTRLFRAKQLRLKNGDILVLHAEGPEGSFAKEKLRDIMNRCRSAKEPATPDAVLRRTGETLDTQAYAEVVLQFHKADRRESACVVPAHPDSAQRVLDYIKESALQKGLSLRKAAHIAVAAEELFILCCRAADGTGELRVLCSVAEDGGAVSLSVEGDFGGADPLEQDDGERSGAADFIRARSDYQQFRSEEGRDTLTAVFFPEAGEP